MKLLVVNADDFGLSPAVSRGIVRAHREGLVTSASVITNLPDFAGTLERLRECPELGVGVHLNLTCGPPLAPDSALAGVSGELPPPRTLLARLASGRVRSADIESELTAQVAKLVGVGIELDHLDSHHNVHLHPWVRAAVERVAERFGIRWVRFRGQMPRLAPRLGGSTAARLRRLARHAIARLACRLAATTWEGSERRAAIFGAPQIEGVSAAAWLRAALAAAGEGVTEIACHPGTADRTLLERDPATRGREEELGALLDPALRSLALARGFTLTHYGRLRDGPR